VTQIPKSHEEQFSDLLSKEGVPQHVVDSMSLQQLLDDFAKHEKAQAAKAEVQTLSSLRTGRHAPCAFDAKAARRKSAMKQEKFDNSGDETAEGVTDSCDSTENVSESERDESRRCTDTSSSGVSEVWDNKAPSSESPSVRGRLADLAKAHQGLMRKDVLRKKSTVRFAIPNDEEEDVEEDVLGKLRELKAPPGGARGAICPETGKFKPSRRTLIACADGIPGAIP